MILSIPGITKCLLVFVFLHQSVLFQLYDGIETEPDWITYDTAVIHLNTSRGQGRDVKFRSLKNWL